MATIVRQEPVGDGYDVLLDDGSVIHFQSRPVDVQADVDAFVAARQAAVVTYTILGETDV